MDKNDWHELKLTGRQLRVLERALDLYLRVGLGQLDMVADAVEQLMPERLKRIGYQHSDMAADLLWIKNEHLHFAVGSSYGVGNDEISDDANVAYEMEKLAQNQIADTEGTGKWTVWRNKPLKVSRERLAEFERVEVPRGVVEVADTESVPAVVNHPTLASFIAAAEECGTRDVRVEEGDSAESGAGGVEVVATCAGGRLRELHRWSDAVARDGVDRLSADRVGEMLGLCGFAVSAGRWTVEEVEDLSEGGFDSCAARPVEASTARRDDGG